MSDEPALEVIATSLPDAIAAVGGGATRLEIVSGMEHGGLTPSPQIVASIRHALPGVPLRVMLRNNGGFAVTPTELGELKRQARELREIGAGGFVFGFVTPKGEIDAASTAALADLVAPSPWTFHRAFDTVRDSARAWQVLASMTRVDLVLTAGSWRDLTAGLEVVCARASWQRNRLRFLAGGGLTPQHMAPLRNAGITQFHIGRGARIADTWASPVDVTRVRRWRSALGSSAHQGSSSGT